VQMDIQCRSLLDLDEDQVIRVIARAPRNETAEQLDVIDREVRDYHNILLDERLYFCEIERGDASEFEETLHIKGDLVGKHVVLRATSSVIPNALAAILIHLEKITGHVPHGYFKWHEDNPIGNLFLFLFIGEAYVEPVVHE